MQAFLTKKGIEESMYGGNVHLLTFKCEDGKSRRSWVSAQNRNFKHWRKIIEEIPVGATIGNLTIKKNLIDADGVPTIDAVPDGGIVEERWIIFQHPLINGGFPCKIIEDQLAEWQRMAKEKEAAKV